jgi:hypothetical protein
VKGAGFLSGEDVERRSSEVVWCERLSGAKAGNLERPPLAEEGVAVSMVIVWDINLVAQGQVMGM